MVKARVTVFPRREILDPQGKAIEGALARIGFSMVREVRAGKSFDLTLDAPNREAAAQAIEAMCERLLANLVVEDYAFEILGEPAEAPR